MSAYAFRRDAGEFSVDAWRPLDRAVYRWVIAHGGSHVLAYYAAWASLADGSGDTALELHFDACQRLGVDTPSDEALEHLRSEPMVGQGGDQPVRPFVLDAARRFYLHRNHAHEVRAAAALCARLHDATVAEASDADIDVLFDGRRDAAVQSQRAAVRRVLSQRLLVLAGGPGTGKTTTVMRMLALLQRHASAPLTVLAAAPTGKAAQRLTAAMRGSHALLRASVAQDKHWQDALDALADVEAVTVHRLLAFDARRNVFRRGSAQPLAADVVVVDEASMLDLGTLRSLLDATPADATLLLVGDPDQLTSVAAGSVMMDLVSALEALQSPALCRLDHSFRAERHLVALNEAVRSGARAALDDAFEGAGLYAQLHEVRDAGQLAAELKGWAQWLASHIERPVVDASAPDIAVVREALAVLGRAQLLCALRDDVFGAAQANRQIEQQLRRAWQCEGQAWYSGRAVLVTRNDYASGLFNGDIGLCLAGTDGALQVWFEGADGMRAFAPSALPAHDSAFAITIHKSQGSEYDRVAVLLPPDGASRVLSRQLLYTAVSRARQAVTLWCDQASLDAALARPVQRAGGLAERLRALAG